jgi:hypothetical protein
MADSEAAARFRDGGAAPAELGDLLEQRPRRASLLILLER